LATQLSRGGLGQPLAGVPSSLSDPASTKSCRPPMRPRCGPHAGW
jgi:hypothetical protein